MARMKNFNVSGGGSGGYSSGEITAANYAERAKQACISSGRPDGSHPVIAKGTQEWEHWMRYFKKIGHPHGNENSFACIHGKLTVPTITPDEFDPGWSMRPITIDATVTKQKTEREVYLDTLTPDEREASRQRVKSMTDEIKRSIANASLSDKNEKN